MYLLLSIIINIVWPYTLPKRQVYSKNTSYTMPYRIYTLNLTHKPSRTLLYLLLVCVLFVCKHIRTIFEGVCQSTNGRSAISVHDTNICVQLPSDMVCVHTFYDRRESYWLTHIKRCSICLLCGI